jgi:hypothetical protein
MKNLFYVYLVGLMFYTNIILNSDSSEKNLKPYSYNKELQPSKSILKKISTTRFSNTPNWRESQSLTDYLLENFEDVYLTKQTILYEKKMRELRLKKDEVK